MRCPHCNLGVRPVEVTGESVDSAPQVTPAPENTGPTQPAAETRSVSPLPASQTEAIGPPDATLPTAKPASDPLDNPRIVEKAVHSLLMKEAVLREARAEGKLGIPNTVDCSRVRGATILIGLSTFLFAGLAVLAIFLGGTTNPLSVILLIPAVLLTFAASLGFIGQFFKDRTLPLPDQRTGPERGLHAFLGALCRGKFEYAHWCLVPGARKEGDDAAVAELGRHWHPIVRHAISGGYGVRRYSFRCEKQADDFALTYGELKVPERDEMLSKAALVTMSPLLFVLSRAGSGVLGLKKLMRQIDGQWYVVDDAHGSKEDLFFDEAVRIAKLSDEEIQAELVHYTDGKC